MIKDLVESIVKSLVDAPDAVAVSVIHDGAKILVEVRVAPEDFKCVIGKDGSIIKAVRALVIILSPDSKEIRLDVVK